VRPLAERRHVLRTRTAPPHEIRRAASDRRGRRIHDDDRCLGLGRDIGDRHGMRGEIEADMFMAHTKQNQGLNERLQKIIGDDARDDTSHGFLGVGASSGRTAGYAGGGGRAGNYCSGIGSSGGGVPSAVWSLMAAYVLEVRTAIERAMLIALSKRVASRQHDTCPEPIGSPQARFAVLAEPSERQ
jgi:hypothetical protein